MTKEEPGLPRKDLRTHTKDGKPRKKARTRRVDPYRFAKTYLEVGRNATEASRRTRGAISSAGFNRQHGYSMLKKPEVQNAIKMLETELEKSAVKAIRKVDQLIDSEDEQIAGLNSRYVIDHVKGKAVARNINANFDIQAAIDELII